MFQNSFYWHLIRKYVILFGTLFKDTYIKRYDDNGLEIGDIKVPIQYAPKDKLFVRLLDNPDANRDYATILPRMSFEIVQPGFQYDAQRKFGSINKWTQANTSNLGRVQAQYQPVPYDISFALYIYANDMEDALKIVESIVPMFTPDWTANVWLIPEINEKRDIPIIMTGGPVMTDIYDGDFKKRRMITFTLNFVMKAWFFGPIKQKPIIKFIDVNVSALNHEDVELTANDATLDFIIQGQPAMLANGSPTSNIAQSVPVTTISILNDFGYGEVTNVVISEGPSFDKTTLYALPAIPGLMIIDTANTNWQFGTPVSGNDTLILHNQASANVYGNIVTIKNGIVWFQQSNGNWYYNISNTNNFTPNGNTGPF
jgi:hypothetical protein